MTLTVVPSGSPCGAHITGVDLSQELDSQTVSEIRQIWLEHKVVAFPDQHLTDDDQERFSLYFGEFATNPYIASIKGRPHMIELRRTADETSPIFASAWHTDWSFGKTPPMATILYGITIPPHGGNTDFINQEKALDDMPADLRDRLEGKTAQHSARFAYAPKDGMYGDQEKGVKRGFKITPRESANAVNAHPIIRCHPETGSEALYGCYGYVLGFEDMPEEESNNLLMDLYDWQTREAFQYHHRWEENMLVMWDNRALLHRANGGYEGYDRVLHRTVIK